MAANDELKVRCPSCGSKYKLPADAVGRKLRCAKCHNAFRVTDPRADSHRLPSPNDKQTSAPPRSSSPQNTEKPGPAKRPPTEDDILRWLNEADDDAGRERRVEMTVDDEVRPDAVTAHESTSSSQPRLRIAREESASDALMMRRVV